MLGDGPGHSEEQIHFEATQKALENKIEEVAEVVQTMINDLVDKRDRMKERGDSEAKDLAKDLERPILILEGNIEEIRKAKEIKEVNKTLEDSKDIYQRWRMK